MGVRIIRYSDRPELWQRITDLSAEVWPEYNLHSDVVGAHWPGLYEQFPDFQFVLYDDEQDEVLAEGQTVPCFWDGSMSSLGPRIDDTIARAFESGRFGWPSEHALRARRRVPPRHREKRLATVVLTGMADTARAVRRAPGARRAPGTGGQALARSDAAAGAPRGRP